MTISRVQAGVPTGGQFATVTHAEPTLTLIEGGGDADAAATTDWGSVSGVHIGSRTPWGTADGVNHPAPGIVQVGTPSHGGVKLSPQRNAAIPGPLRNSSGWYEEDCEAAIVGLYHPEAFPRAAGGDMDAAREHFRATVVGYFPDQYEKATGEQLTLGASYAKDREAYYADKDGQTLVYSTGASEDPEFPGYVNVTTKVHGRDGFTQHLIPVDAYRNLDRRYGAADVSPLLPAGSIDITPPEPKKEPEPPTPRCRKVDLKSLTALQRRRAEGDLDKRWRDHDGRVVTLRQLIDEGHVVGKLKAVGDNDRNGFYLTMAKVPEGQPGGDTRLWPVSAATYKAMDAPGPVKQNPEDWRAAAAEKERVARETARAAYDKAMAERGRTLRVVR